MNKSGRESKRRSLPFELDGVRIDENTDFPALVARKLGGRTPARARSATRKTRTDWALKLWSSLAGTGLEDEVGRAVGACLRSTDALARASALRFFDSVGQVPGSEVIEEVAAVSDVDPLDSVLDPTYDYGVTLGMSLRIGLWSRIRSLRESGVDPDRALAIAKRSEESSVPKRWAPISTLTEDTRAATDASVPGSSSRLDAVTRRLLADLRGSSATAIRAALERITDARKQGERTPAHLHQAIHYIFTDARTDPETRRLAALYYVGAALDGLASPELAARRRAARYIWGWACDRHGRPSTDKFPFVAAAVPAALDDPDEEVRHSATLALLIRNWKRALEDTTELAEWALRSASPDRRKSAAQALRTALGEPDAASAATLLVPLVIEGLLAPDEPSARAMSQPRELAAYAAMALIKAGADVRAVIPHVVEWLSRPSAGSGSACELLEVAAEHGIDISAAIPHVVEWLSRATAGSGSAWRPCELLEVAAKHGIDISAAVPALEAASARPVAGVRPAASRALSHHFCNTGQEAALTRHDFTKYLGECTRLELSHRPVHAETDQEVKGAEPGRCGHCGSEQTACVFSAPSPSPPMVHVETLEYRCTACGKFTVYTIFTYDD